jgi:thiol-disulfide isomerase/thioredoxin
VGVRIAASFLLATCAMAMLGGASCKKESRAQDVGAIGAADRLGGRGGGIPADQPIDTTPVPGVDTSKLDDQQQRAFYALIDAFPSPCGKAHSLRTSVAEDAACTRAPFAAKYLLALLADDLSIDEARESWAAKYKAEGERVRFELEGVPRSGSAAAPIQIVEFYDYGCPGCASIRPILDEVASQNASTTAVYYKQFPLTDRHPNSMSAAQAALAAHAQGKFAEMHELLFRKAPNHKRADVLRYARELGLDPARFEADYEAAQAKVRADIAEGDRHGVHGTPTIFFNGRLYTGPWHPRYFGYWIAEDLAVNR